MRTIVGRMPLAPSNGIELYYETHGDPADPALLLVNGYSSQILQWGDGFREGLAGRGRYVISFDNRDVGKSTHLDGVDADGVPYTLSTFGDDGIGLLDQLGVEAAHIAGSSMGGMIVQQMAIDHPSRVLTMTSIMSTTSEPGYFESSPEAMEALMTPGPAEREAFIADSVEKSAIFASNRYFDAQEAAARTAAAYDRAFYPEGMVRQMAAVQGSADRSEGLAKLTTPTLVIHGMDDTLIMPSGGQRTAELIPGANLLLLHDMGHDLPRPLWPVVIDAMVSHTTNAIG